MNLNQDVLNHILDYAHEQPSLGRIFPNNYSLCKEMREAWQRKLHHAVQQVDANVWMVRKNHRISWTWPVDAYVKSNAFFNGIDFLLESQPFLSLATRRESHDRLFVLRDVALNLSFVDANLMLDGTIRLLPSLDIPSLQWKVVDNPCTLDYEVEEPVTVMLRDMSVRQVPRNCFPDWDFDHQFVEEGQLVHSHHDLKGPMKGVGHFRDMYTCLLTEPCLFPSYLAIKRGVRKAN